MRVIKWILSPKGNIKLSIWILLPNEDTYVQREIITNGLRLAIKQPDQAKQDKDQSTETKTEKKTTFFA